MSHIIEKSPLFHLDVTSQFGWYADNAGDKIAWEFYDAVDMTILKLSQRPDIGRIQRFRHPLLRQLRSFQVDPPFQKLLIFYRSTEDTLLVWRLMHGARDLARRLSDPPASGN